MHRPSSILSPRDWTDILSPYTIFENPHRPLEVDVGCGKGRFLLARAKANPLTNFLGIDRLAKRLQKVDAKITREKLVNIRLLHLDAAHVIDYLLPPASVSMFHIFFSDPWPKRRHHGRRLFSAAFLDALNRTLAPGGQVNIATDHMDYFTEIGSLFRRDARFAATPAFLPPEEERTNFELTFMEKGVQIGRCSFRKLESPAASPG